MRQKDRRQKRVHSVSSFCFVVFRPQSLLDILESQVMKRMSINHCVEVDAYIHGNVSRVQITSTDISGSGRQSCEPEFNYRMSFFVFGDSLINAFSLILCVVELEKAETQAFRG